jgi:hypothetical protein
MVFLVVFLCACGGEKEKEEDKAADNNLAWWVNSDVTESAVTAALNSEADINPAPSDSGFPGNVTQISIVDNASGGKNISVHFTPSAVRDETDLVRKFGSATIIAGNKLFANQLVSEVAVFATIQMTDQYGNTKPETALKIVISRELADKLNWESFADKHISDPGAIYRITDNRYIHPGILNYVKPDKFVLE